MIKKFFLSTHNNNLSKRWYIHYTDKNKAGRVVTKKVYEGINRGRTVEERLIIANKILERLNNQGISKEKKVRNTKPNHLPTAFNQAIEAIRPTLRKKTYQAYQSKVRIFIDWCNKHKITYFKDLNNEVVRHFFNDMLDNKRSNATYNGYKVSLQRLAKEIPNFDITVFKIVKKLQNTSVPCAFFQDRHIKILQPIIEAQNPQLWLVCQFIYFTLVRPGELRLLKIGDINFQDATIQINADISKNKKTEIVTIPDELMKLFIDAKFFEYPEHFYIFGVGGMPSPRRRRKNYFQEAHLAILRQLKFDTSKYKLYSWKHTAVRNLIRLKVPLKFIQMQGRWHDLDQLNQYVRLMGIEDMTEIKERHTLWVNKE